MHPACGHRLTSIAQIAAVLGVLALTSGACSTEQIDPVASTGAAQDPPATSSTTSSVLAAGSSPSADTGFPADWQPAPLDWEGCDVAPRAQCASLEVPLDWDDPQGEQIDLALARIRARGERIGSLLSNPGGPGGSGIQYLGYSPFSSDLADRFDLVSWDPRGVGSSTPVTCGDTVPDFLALDPSPDDSRERDDIEGAADAVARECEASDGDLLANVNTAEVARDLEAIRLALGAEPLNYIGFSYGTHIGQLYAEMFGASVRAMVLDGVVDPSAGFEDFLLGQTAAFEEAFEGHARRCAEAGTRSCGVDDLPAAYDEVAETLEEQPLQTDAGEVGPSELATAAAFVGYRPQGWSSLGAALGDALDGDGSALRDLADGYRELAPYGPYAAVVCTDSQRPVGTEAYREFEARAEDISARFGPSIANEMLPCATWGADPQGAAAAVTAPGAPPILVVGNTGDPATPIGNARAVARSLESGHLLEVEMDGHTAYRSNDCATGVIDDYLIELTLPTDDRRC